MQIENKVDKKDKATSADAEAGTSDDKWMTPVTTKQMLERNKNVNVDGKLMTLFTPNVIVPDVVSYYTVSSIHVVADTEGYFLYTILNGNNFDIYAINKKTGKSMLALHLTHSKPSGIPQDKYNKTLGTANCIYGCIPGYTNRFLIANNHSIRIIEFSENDNSCTGRIVKTFSGYTIPYTRGSSSSDVPNITPNMGKTYFALVEWYPGSDYKTVAIPYAKYTDSTLTVKTGLYRDQYYRGGIVGQHYMAVPYYSSSSEFNVYWLDLATGGNGVNTVTPPATVAGSSYPSVAIATDKVNDLLILTAQNGINLAVLFFDSYLHIAGAKKAQITSTNVTVDQSTFDRYSSVNTRRFTNGIHYICDYSNLNDIEIIVPTSDIPALIAAANFALMGDLMVKNNRDSISFFNKMLEPIGTFPGFATSGLSVDFISSVVENAIFIRLVYEAAQYNNREIPAIISTKKLKYLASAFYTTEE